jgi:hypothetical protein
VGRHVNQPSPPLCRTIGAQLISSWRRWSPRRRSSPTSPIGAGCPLRDDEQGPSLTERRIDLGVRVRRDNRLVDIDHARGPKAFGPAGGGAA